jgi:TRAP-type C4-dicarboxylate transport system permease small subunit
MTVVQAGETVACAIGLTATTLLIFAQVVNRYWLHFEIMILGDLALYCFIFFMFIAAAVATWNETHVSVDILRAKVLRDKPMSLAVHRVVMAVLSIGILCLILPPVYRFLLRAIEYPEYGTLVRWFNTSWIMGTFAFGMILVLVHLLVLAVRDVRELRALRSGRDGEAV